MHELEQTTVGCPYCGETIDVFLDQSNAGQEYIEDCQVCCRPIVFALTVTGDGGVDVSVRAEDETF